MTAFLSDPFPLLTGLLACLVTSILIASFITDLAKGAI